MNLSTLERLGKDLDAVSGALGASDFEQRLAEFIGRGIRHDMMTMTRYSTVSEPTFLIHPTNYPRDWVEGYLTLYHLFDPFAAYWRDKRTPGVVSLSDLSSGQRKVGRYIREFLPQTGIADEIGIFLPPLAGATLAVFFESTGRKFSKSEREVLNALYPLAANLYKAHLKVIFNAPNSRRAGSLTTQSPMLITDRDGQTVWATDAWRQLSTEAHTQATAAVEARPGPELHITRLDGGMTLVSEALELTSDGGPGQLLWSLEADARGQAQPDPLAVGTRQFDAVLSPRECEIVELILTGHPTTLIAEKLGLSRGTVKNHRRRIYDKLDITTERELFLMYIEAALGTGA